eukprot:CAMPEP_0198688852 /NCGR_PEP_ID=MMETSP1468-20131203/121021_1 /TAXON_ID=1461545 /ORGANISM="Mantoniella sp, Strain CCMP1436" /LENGTH=83 /DNA_ID=CAMNT_0044439149 /DNA_START=141 /DNA_END=392 /DNA_ORIENTATION=+
MRHKEGTGQNTTRGGRDMLNCCDPGLTLGMCSWRVATLESELIQASPFYGDVNDSCVLVDVMPRSDCNLDPALRAPLLLSAPL